MAAKLSPSWFADLVQKLNVPASAVVVIGDNERTDLEPAKKLGAATALIGKNGRNVDWETESITNLIQELTTTRITE